MARDGEELEIRRRLDACFNLQIDRDCENCLAHGDYDGPCCFGKKFDEYDDEDCAKCPHHDDCAEECGYELSDPDDVRIGPKGDRVAPLGPPIKPSIWDRLKAGRINSPVPAVVSPTRFTIQGRTGSISPNAPRTGLALAAQAQTTVIKEGEYRYIPMDNRIPIGEGNPEESVGKRFVKDSVWGGGEGFFRSAYEFFRTHRWR